MSVSIKKHVTYFYKFTMNVQIKTMLLRQLSFSSSTVLSSALLASIAFLLLSFKFIISSSWSLQTLIIFLLRWHRTPGGSKEWFLSSKIHQNNISTLISSDEFFMGTLVWQRKCLHTICVVAIDIDKVRISKSKQPEFHKTFLFIH